MRTLSQSVPRSIIRMEHGELEMSVIWTPSFRLTVWSPNRWWCQPPQAEWIQLCIMSMKYMFVETDYIYCFWMFRGRPVSGTTAVGIHCLSNCLWYGVSWVTELHSQRLSCTQHSSWRSKQRKNCRFWSCPTDQGMLKNYAQEGLFLHKLGYMQCLVEKVMWWLSLLFTLDGWQDTKSWPKSLVQRLLFDVNDHNSIIIVNTMTELVN